MKIQSSGEKNEHPARAKAGQKPPRDLASTLKLFLPSPRPDSSPARRLNANARDGKKADSVTETIRSA